MFAYEPPRPGARIIVFTLFRLADPFRVLAAYMFREEFSTAGFASMNGLGPPLSAAFFYINYENNQNQEIDDRGSHRRRSALSNKKRKRKRKQKESRKGRSYKKRKERD